MRLKDLFLSLFKPKVSETTQIADLLNLPKTLEDLKSGDFVKFKGQEYSNLHVTFGKSYEIFSKNGPSFMEGPSLTIKNDIGVLVDILYYDFVIILDPKIKELIPGNARIPHLYKSIDC